MRTTLPACPKNRTSRGLPRLAMAAVAVLTVPAFLVGPSAAGASGTAPAATTARSATTTVTAGAATTTAPPAATTTARATAPTPIAAVAPTAPGKRTVGEPTVEPTRHRTAKATRNPLTQYRPTCGGKLAFGKVETCRSIVDRQEHKWTVTSTADQDVLVTQLGRGSGEFSVGASVTDAAGQHVCRFSNDSGSCQLGAAGTYTITVTLPYPTGRGDYTIAVESTRTPSACETLPESYFSFGSPGVTKSLPAGAAAQCYTFDQPVNSVLQVAEPLGSGDIQGQILDASYESLCEIRYGGMCTLSTQGPYRLLVREYYGTAGSYTLKMPRLSNPVGCQAVALASFGDPGTATGGGTVRKADVACHTFTAAAAIPVLVRFQRLDDQWIWWDVYDTTGRAVCNEFENQRSCPLPAAGTYTVMVRHQDGTDNDVDYQVAVARLDGSDGCAATAGISWDQPSVRLHQTSPVQTNCQPFEGEAGDRVVTYDSPDEYGEAFMWLVDESGAWICTEAGNDGCVLPAAGSYRAISYLWEWNDDYTDLTYRIQIRRLSNAVGCPTVAVGSYGVAPAPGGIRCRTLEVPEAGDYRLSTPSADGYETFGRVYDQEGSIVCGTGRCTFPAAGRYTMVLDGSSPYAVLENDVEHAVSLLPWAPSGCVAVSDAGWREAPHRGAFQGAGQVNCLQLASPAGARIVQSQPGEVTGDTSPEITVVDATGDYQCDYSELRQYSCKLTGQAPFYAVLNAAVGNPTGAYAMAFSRVDGPPACPVLPRDATGATATTGADRFVVCYSIPADQHGARESFTWARTSGAGDARLSVLDGQGIRYCGPGPYAVERTTTCTLPAGPVTVLLESDAVAATYRLTHRDATTS
ncbi:hypothetical protein ABTX15_19360 [Micromonospora sp. NPDC094482]|uniref:hypothetical protein n=1 Tax=unclassified Micromonospora TaxID=2617518 RepID=UPI00332E2F5D